MKKHKRITRMAAILFAVLLAFAPCAEAASSPTVPIGRSGTVYFSQRQRYKSPSGNTVSLESGWYAFVKESNCAGYEIYRCTYPPNHYWHKVRVYPGDPIHTAALGNKPY